MEKHILLVEDESIIALAEAELLERYGFDVTVVHSGKRAVEVALTENIDLVLLDIDLGRGRMDGVTAAETILRKKDLPIVFVTGHAEQEMVEKVKGITRYGYVLKNSGEFVLLESVRMALQLFEAHSRARDREDRLRENSIFLQGIFDSIQDGISILNPDLTIRTANRVMKTWYEHSRPLAGKKCYSCYHNSDTVCSPCPSLACMESGKTESAVVPGPPGSEITWLELYSYPMRDPSNGKISGIIEFVRNITDRKITEEELKRNQQLFTSIVENIPNMVFLKEAEDLTFYLVNSAAEELMGMSREYLLGKGDFEIFPPHEAVFFRKTDSEVVRTGKKTVIHEEKITTPDGIRYLYTKKVPIFDDSGRPEYMLGISEDITRRRAAEEKVQNLLREKELLLKEVHHRIKNNMSTISSMLALQCSAVSNETAANALREARRRISLMGSIYDKLYRSENISSLGVKAFLEELIAEVRNTYSSADPIEVKTLITDFDLSPNQTFSLGIIVNELITNSFKYAYPDGNGGRISVSVALRGPKQIEIRAEDDGCGVPPEVAGGEAYGFGLTLIEAYVSQYNGNLSIESHEGTKITVLVEIEPA